MLGVIVAIIGFIVPLVVPNGDRQANIDNVQARINTIIEGKNFYQTGEELEPDDLIVKSARLLFVRWSEFTDAIKPLNFHNRQVAEAKAIMRFKFECPDSHTYRELCNSFVYSNREYYSAKPWQVEEIDEQIFRAIYTSFLAFMACTTLVFTLLFLMNSMWYFILARVREFGDALRGKQ